MQRLRTIIQGDLVEPKFTLEGPRTAGGLSLHNRKKSFQGVVLAKPYKVDKNSEFFIDLLVQGKILKRCFVDDYVVSNDLVHNGGKNK